MARKTIIAGNWKMNLIPAQAEELIFDLKEGLVNKPNLEVVIIPQAGLIPYVKEWTLDSAIQVGAQNCSAYISGAHTGESSPELLRVLGCNYCLTGHSERREMYGGTNEVIAQKVQSICQFNMTPIVCVGETLEEREAGEHLKKIKKQVHTIFSTIESEFWTKLVFAYEPIWAIGTGKTASKEQANEIHQFIRNEICEVAGEVIANSVSILYGGSVKPANAKELMDQSDIDGVLVGGASLKADDFSKIIEAF